MLTTSTPTLPGATAGHGTITVESTNTVNACHEVTSTHGTHVGCAGIDPPPGSELLGDVFGFVNGAVVDHVDPAACPALAAAAGAYGDVVITAQGDVYVGGDPVWDCPPYDSWPPS